MALSAVATYHLAATGNNPSLLTSSVARVWPTEILVLIIVSCFLAVCAVQCMYEKSGRAAVHLIFRGFFDGVYFFYATSSLLVAHRLNFQRSFSSTSDVLPVFGLILERQPLLRCSGALWIANWKAPFQNLQDCWAAEGPHEAPINQPSLSIKMSLRRRPPPSLSMS